MTSTHICSQIRRQLFYENKINDISIVPIVPIVPITLFTMLVIGDSTTHIQHTSRFSYRDIRSTQRKGGYTGHSLKNTQME